MSLQSPEEVITALEEAVNAHDLDAFVELHEPDAVLVTSPDGAARAHGHGEIRTTLAPIFASQPRTRIEPQGLLETDGMAMCHSHSTVNLTRSNGETVETAGMGTVVTRRQPDDGWLVVFNFPMRA